MYPDFLMPPKDDRDRHEPESFYEKKLDRNTEAACGISHTAEEHATNP